MNCDSCQNEEGALLITQLHNGDTVSLGPRCIPTWLDAMQATVRGEGEEVPPHDPDAETDEDVDAAPPETPAEAPEAPVTTPEPEVSAETPEETPQEPTARTRRRRVA